MSKKSNKRKSGMSTRACVTMLALVLVLGCAVGGTIAWLTAQTEPVKNTFTYGKVDIELKERKYDQTTNTLKDEYVTENTYKIVPGMNMPKDPFITVLSDSEDCWVFLKVEEENFIDGLSYRLCDYWVPVAGETNVYYSKEPNSAKYPVEEYPYGAPTGKNMNLSILDPISAATGDMNTITVSGDISKEDLEALGSKQPQLKFTAYAVQGSYSRNPNNAWNVIKEQLAAESED